MCFTACYLYDLDSSQSLIRDCTSPYVFPSSASTKIYDVHRTGYIEAEHVGRLLDAIYGQDNTNVVDVAISWLFRRSRRDVVLMCAPRCPSTIYEPKALVGVL